MLIEKGKSSIVQRDATVHASRVCDTFKGRRLEWRSDGADGHGLGRLHDLLLGGFDGDGKTELGGVLVKSS